MENKLYVGNLPFSADDAQLAEIFSHAGQVTSAKVIFDRFSGRSKGFGFVEMATDADAQAAIEKLDGGEYNGRTISVAVAKPMEPKPEKNSKPEVKISGDGAAIAAAATDEPSNEVLSPEAKTE